MSDLLEAAAAFAWLPFANLSAGPVYDARRAAFDHLAVLIAAQPPLVWRALPPDLGRALKRVANVSPANRRGLPYYERKSAILELRGCLDAHRSWIGA